MITKFRVTSDTGKYIEYSLMMAIGNEDTEATAQIHSGLSEEALAAIRPVEIPELPALSLEGPAYMVVEGDVDETGRSDMLDYLHRMYAKEGYRLSQEYGQRMREYEQKKAYYLANPPKPKDVVLHYWRGKRSSEQSETP